MQVSTVTQSIAAVAISLMPLAQLAHVRCGCCGTVFAPVFALQKCAACEAEYAEFDALNAEYQAEQGQIELERMAGIQAEAERERLDAEGKLKRPLPDYCDGPNADRAEYLAEQGFLFSSCRRAGMNMARRIEGAAKYLGLATLSSWKQLSPGEMGRLRFAINQGFLTTEWELADDEPAMAQRIEVSDEDFARIVD